ncbi:MAG TPA: carboxypeptidase regulatory-like domain-containing protein [Holophagaceae bacterium]|nr:carboxypeptidase regulatory-like domain-containing protein [Holophagaceae bacterium]
MLFFLAASLPLLAQSTGVTTADLQGAVQDGSSRKALPGAEVRVQRRSTGETFLQKADGGGRFHLRLLPVGLYDLEVRAPGFNPRRIPGLSLNVGATRGVEVALAPIAETSVAVEATHPMLDPSNTQVSALVDQRAIQNLPINRRTYQDFSLTTPQVTTGNPAVASAGSGSSNLVFAGVTPRQNNFLVDGLDNNDLGGGAVRQSFSQEAIQEFQVVTDGFSAEYGRAAGGVLNIVTKSGGNTFSGSTFFFERPGSLDARAPQGTGTREYRQHQYGASVSGPLVKDRLYYFVAVERMEARDENQVTIDPAALAALDSGGFPTAGGPQGFSQRDSSAFLRLDYDQSPTSRWSLRFNLGSALDENQLPWGGITARSAGGSRRTTDRGYALSHQWTPSATLLNDFRFLYGVRSNTFESLDATGGVGVVILGTATVGTNRLAPQDAHVQYRHLVDTVTLLAGDHTLKAGVDLLSSVNEATVPQNFAGVQIFAALPTLGIPTALMAFQFGVPAAFVQSFGDPHLRFSAAYDSAFLQEEWQATPALLLKAGLRYDRQRLPTFPEAAAYQALDNPPATVDPTYGPTRLPDGPHPYSRLMHAHRTWTDARLSPRLAFSWHPDAHWKLYGGAGEFAGSVLLGPLYGTQLFNGTNIQTVIQTLQDPPAQSSLAAWAQPGHRYASVPAGPQTLTVPGEQSLPHTRQLNLGLEWTPRPDLRVALDLVKSKGASFNNARDVNAFVVYDNGGTPVLRRPDLRFSSVILTDGTGESRYLAQSLSLTWKPREAFSLQASYTHSKTEDNYIDYTTDYKAQDTFDVGSEWGPSSQDQTHRAVVSGVWMSSSQAHAWARDWTLAFIARYASGRPYTRLLGYDQNLNGDATSDRPVGLGRNTETGPSTRNLDLRIARSFPLGATRLELRAEVFNCFNTTNVLLQQNDLSSTTPAYGSPIAYGPKRQFQFGARLTF